MGALAHLPPTYLLVTYLPVARKAYGLAYLLTDLPTYLLLTCISTAALIDVIVSEGSLGTTRNAARLACKYRR